MQGFFIIIIPFIGTITGAAAVFFINRKIAEKSENSLLGFASGVMLSAAVWSLLIPSAELARAQGKAAWLPTVSGFAAGIIFLIFSDVFLSHIKKENEKQPSKRALLIFAVTLHNIPEGMAVGVAVAGALSKSSAITLASAFMLSLGIAIQNIPEGSIISMPLESAGASKPRAFLYGGLSGAVEPIAALITMLFVTGLYSIMPYVLSFAAGAMFYVVTEELIPETHSTEKEYSAIISFTVGFCFMMFLDVVFS